MTDPAAVAAYAALVAAVSGAITNILIVAGHVAERIIRAKRGDPCKPPKPGKPIAPPIAPGNPPAVQSDPPPPKGTDHA